MRAKRAENFWIYKRFLGQFGKKKKKKKKKIHPTDRPLFGICSPVEQGFFFFLGLSKVYSIVDHWNGLISCQLLVNINLRAFYQELFQQTTYASIDLIKILHLNSFHDC